MVPLKVASGCLLYKGRGLNSHPLSYHNSEQQAARQCMHNIATSNPMFHIGKLHLLLITSPSVLLERKKKLLWYYACETKLIALATESVNKFVL